MRTLLPAAFALLVALAFAVPASAQMVAAELPDNHTACVLLADHPDMLRADELTQRIRANYDPNVRATATFTVNYTGFTAPAQTAFQFAVDIWSQHLDSSVPIEVDASFTPLGTNVLGSAGAINIFRDFGGAPIPNTWYPNALVDAITGSDVDVAGGTAEIMARFSSNFTNWYFGTDGNTPGGQFDFVSVVLHELGHGLGFFGSGNFDDGVTNGGNPQECDEMTGNGCWGLGSGFPVVYDRFVEDVGTTSMLEGATYPNPSSALGTLLISNNVFFDSPTVVTVLTDRERIYAPTPWNPGSSFSHWNEGSFGAGTENALMTPFISPGETLHSPGPATCALFQDLGWSLGPMCQALVTSIEDPVAVLPTDGFSLDAPAPNPFTHQATLGLRVAQAQTVRAELVDILGRRVAVLFEGAVAPGTTIPLTVSGAELSPAIYLVRVVGQQFATTQRLVRAR